MLGNETCMNAVGLSTYITWHMDHMTQTIRDDV